MLGKSSEQDKGVYRREIVECDFLGQGESSGPLSWAQRYMWHVINLPENYYRMDLFLDVTAPGNISVEATLRCVRRLMDKHPTLRTTITHDGQDRTYQRVLGVGSVPVHLIYSARPLQFEELRAELPPLPAPMLVSGLILLVNEIVTRVVVRMNHLVTDQWGRQILRDDLAADLRCAAEGIVGEPAPQERSSVDLALLDSSSAGQTSNKRSLAHAATQLTAAPQTMFPHPHLSPEIPRYWDVEMHSEALAYALTAVAAENHVPVSGPIVASFARVMATRAALPSSLIYLGTANRFLPAWRDFSGPLYQETLVTIPMHYETHRDLIRAVSPRILLAYLHGRCDPTALATVTSDIEVSRGVSLDKIARAAAINTIDIRPLKKRRTHRMLSQLPPLSGCGKITFAPRAGIDNLSFFMDVIVDDSLVALRARVDTCLVSLQEASGILHAIERLLCATAARDVRIDETSEICSGAGRPVSQETEIIDNSLVSLAACRQVLEDSDTIHHADVQFARNNDEQFVEAYACHKSSPIGVSTLHRNIVKRLASHPLAIAPHRYHLYSTCPACGDHQAGWDNEHLTATGTGRP